MMEKQKCVNIDDVMKNMLLYALRDVFREEKKQGKSIEDTKALVQKLADYDSAKLFLTDVEYHKAVESLNMLRNTYIQGGRYTDGIDIVLMKIIRSKYKRCSVK